VGYTQFTIDLISRHLDGVKSVVDLGSQNLYAGQYDPNKPPFVSEWYKSNGIEYMCIDLAGDNDALSADWSHPINLARRFDLVVDSGSSEHSVQTVEYETVAFHEGHINSVYPKGQVKEQDIFEGFYNCWLNKHEFCKRGGLIISENPKTQNWPLHGYTYLAETFYKGLCLWADYEILELGEHAALGNTTDGYNIYCVLKKNGDYFPKHTEFKTLPIFRQ